MLELKCFLGIMFGVDDSGIKQVWGQPLLDLEIPLLFLGRFL